VATLAQAGDGAASVLGAAIVLRAAAYGLAALILALGVALARPASAHALGLSRGEYAPSGAEVHADVTLRADEVALAVPGLDADGDGRVSVAEVASARGSIAGVILGSLDVSADGARCTARVEDVMPDPPDGLRLRATYSCPHAPRRLKLRFGFLDRMPAGHRHLATMHLPGGDVDTLASSAQPDVDIDVSSGSKHGFTSLLRGGIEHILTGADHLAFLLALVLGGTLVAGVQAGPLVAMLTAFTVGHSASLALATLGGFAPGARLVEPAVALSVAYVGGENLFARSVRHRWMLTLPFGFVHGFAFAGGLLPLGLPRAQLPAALFAFNLGVEAGQLAVLAVLLPPLGLLRARPWYPQAARVASAAIVLAGLAWFVQRVA
jgi:hypothetical protein